MSTTKDVDTYLRSLCTEPGGTTHSWWKAGLVDTPTGLRRLRCCVWCGRERTVAFVPHPDRVYR